MRVTLRTEHSTFFTDDNVTLTPVHLDVMALTKQNLEQFRTEGFTSSVPVLTPSQTTEFRHRLEAIEAVLGPLQGGKRLKCHLLYAWISELIRLPAIVDIVEELLGPDIMCWGTDMWIKDAGSDKFVSWHQDSQYWGIEKGQLLTAWIALSPATVLSGCMRMLPGSHLEAGLNHIDTFHDDNMLTRGQTIKNIDEDRAVNLEAQSGEAIFFTYRLAHASHPNRSNDRRIGIAIRYISPDAMQTKSDWDSATLIRGEDRYGNFEHEPVPQFDFDPTAVAFHQRSNENYRKILYSGTDWKHHRT